MRRFFSRVTLGLTIVYVILLTAYVFFRGFPQDSRGWIYLLNVFALYLFIPTIVLFVVGLLTRSRATLILCAIPLGLFVFLYGELFLPRQIGITSSPATFTLLTHNLRADSPNPQPTIQMLASSGADIILVQELTPQMAEALTTKLEATYPYRSLVPDSGYAGVGVFSHFPIKTEEQFVAGHYGQHLVIDVRGRELDIFNAHPNPPKIWAPGGGHVVPVAGRGVNVASQSSQFSIIEEQVQKAQGPLILAGDFNTTDQTRQYQQIKGSLVDSFRESGYGLGLTFPASRSFLRLPIPLIRIDYVFHSSDLTAVSATIGNQTGSDHLPLLVKLAFNTPDR